MDLAVLAEAADPLPEATLAPVAAHYARMTSDPAAWGPIGAAMVLLVTGALADAWVRGGARRWLALVACALPVLVAVVEVVPDAARLGARLDGVEAQTALARQIAWLHVGDLAAMVSFLCLQLCWSDEASSAP